MRSAGSTARTSLTLAAVLLGLLAALAWWVLAQAPGAGPADGVAAPRVQAADLDRAALAALPGSGDSPQPQALTAPPLGARSPAGAALDDLPTMEVEVVDTAGRPIEGALITRGARRFATTDALGRAVLPGDPGLGADAESGSTLTAKALCYHVATERLPAEPAPLTRLTLKPCAVLYVVVSSERKLDVSDLAVVLHADGPAFEVSLPSGIRGVVGGDKGRRGGRQWPADGKDGNYFCALRPGGTLMLVGLQPEQPLTLTVRGPEDQLLAEQTVSLADGEWRTLDIPLDRFGRRLRGTVRDAAGWPIGTARVGLEAEGKALADGNAPRSGGGAYEFYNLYSERVTVTAQAEGYASRRVPDLELVQDETVLDLVLEPASPFTVSVVDGVSGAPVGRVHGWSTSEPTSRASSRDDEPGVLVFDDVGPEAQEFTIVAAGGTFTVRREAGEARQTLRLPQLGALEVIVQGLPPQAPARASGQRDDLVPVPYSSGGRDWRVLVITPLGGETGRGPQAFFSGRLDRVPTPVRGPGLLPGRYRVAFEKGKSDEDSATSPHAEVDVRAGAVTTVILQL